MRKRRILAAGLVLAVSVTVCGGKPQTSGAQGGNTMGTVWAQTLAEVPDADPNWMGGLNKEQRMQDFESLCNGLRDNYPYLLLAKRQAGADIDVLERSYRQKVELCDNDDMFYETLRDFVREFALTGHLDLWGRRYESELADLKRYFNLKMQESDEKGMAHIAPYIAALDNPVSHKTYAAMTKFYEQTENEVQEQGQEPKESAAVTEEEPWVNVKTKILEPGKTAYVSISLFDYEQMESDRKILLPFYEKVRDYDNLIIDITENPGGSMNYFNELVVAPLAKETLTVPTYQLLKDGQNNRCFLMMEEGISSGLYQPVSKLPELPNLNRENVRDCTYFLQEDYTVHPVGNGFAGKIWLLVSGDNYSSSEYAAMFSKASGFATLVGETTGGDGIGTDPVYLILPNSGLVVQYSPMYGMTADGTGSEEYGTTPDIVSSTGESALDTCLKWIG